MIKRRVIFYVCAAAVCTVVLAIIVVFSDDRGARSALVKKLNELNRKARDPNLSPPDRLKLAKELETAMMGLDGSIEWLGASENLATWYNLAKAPKRAEEVARAALKAENVPPRLQMDLYSRLFDALRKQGRYNDLESERSRAHDLVVRQLQDKRIRGVQRNLWMIHVRETGEPPGSDFDKGLRGDDRTGEISARFAAYADELAQICTLFTDSEATAKASWLCGVAYQYQNAGIIADRAGQFETARKYYKKALDVYPAEMATGREERALRFSLRMRLALTGSLKYQEAHRAEFEAALREYRNDDWFLFNAGNVLTFLPRGIERFGALSVVGKMAIPRKKYIGAATFYMDLGIQAEELGFREVAEQAYTTVIHQYADSSSVLKARRRLDALRRK